MSRSWPEIRPASSPASHCVRLDERDVPFVLRRSARRSVGLLVRDGTLTVSAPTALPLVEIDRLLQRRADWILDKLDQPAVAAPAALAAGGSIDWLGEPRTLQIGHARGGIDGDALRLAAADHAALPKALTRFMQREARDFLAERLARWAERLALQPSGFKLSGARSRWGSCTSRGVIRLNWRLMQAPLPVIDYVIIHELCHLAELNHSPRFWALVAGACPDYKQKRDWLKREGNRYFAW